MIAQVNPPAIVQPAMTQQAVLSRLDKVIAELDYLARVTGLGCVEKFRAAVAELKVVRSEAQLSLPGLEPTPKGRAAIEDVTRYCESLGLPREDGEWFFYKCEGCGWRNNGKAIVDWRSTVRSWKLSKVFPSLKQQWGANRPALNAAAPKGLTPGEKMIAYDEYKRVVESLKNLINTGSAYPVYSEQEKARIRKLKARRDELKAQLNIVC